MISGTSAPAPSILPDGEGECTAHPKDSRIVLHYCRLGWPIIPLRNGKVPQLHDWVHKGTTQRDVVHRWWKQGQFGTGVGILTGRASGLIVVDIDTHDPDCRVDPWDFPPTLMSVTGSAGWHLYYRYPDYAVGHERIPNMIRIIDGVDLKADGGMVVAPPSIHTGTGRRYRWVPADSPFPDVDSIAPLPEFITLAAITPHHSSRTNPRLWSGVERFRPDSFVRVVAESLPGERNNRLNWAAFHAGRGVAQGELDEKLITTELLNAALETGLNRAEAERTIRSGMRAGVNKQW